MIRAAAVLVVLTILAAAPARAQDSTGARPRPRAATGAHLGRVRPRTTRPARQARPAADSTRQTTASVDTARRDTTPAPPPGFRREMSVEPKTVTVGERFESGMAVSVAAGTQLAIEVPKDSADRWRVVGQAKATPRDSARTRWLVVVPMVAWVPGLTDSVAARLRITSPEGRTIDLPVKLAFPTVRAVLPADSTRWRVRPPHDVWGPSRDWRPIALAAAITLLLLALIAWLLAKLIRRRRRRRVPATARERALQLLEKARASGFIEAGNWKAFYTLVSAALRGFAAAMDARWSTDLTSSELVAEMRIGGVDDEHVDTLAELLRVADLAKFARRGRDPDDARRDLDDAKRWVETFARPEESPESTEAVTAEAAP